MPFFLLFFNVRVLVHETPLTPFNISKRILARDFFRHAHSIFDLVQCSNLSDFLRIIQSTYRTNFLSL